MTDHAYSLEDFERDLAAFMDLPKVPGPNEIVGVGVLEIEGVKRRGYMTGDMRFWESELVPDRPFRELKTPIQREANGSWVEVEPRDARERAAQRRRERGSQ